MVEFIFIYYHGIYRNLWDLFNEISLRGWLLFQFVLGSWEVYDLGHLRREFFPKQAHDPFDSEPCSLIPANRGGGAFDTINNVFS